MGNKTTKSNRLMLADSEQQAQYKLKYTVDDEQLKYIIKFVKIYTKSVVDKQRFIILMEMDRTMTREYAERIFEAFDSSNTGILSVEDLLNYFGVVIGTNVEQRLKASFCVFDVDRNGKLTKEGMQAVFMMTAIQEVREAFRQKAGGRPIPGLTVKLDQQTIDSMRALVNEAFEGADVKQKGYLEYDDYIAYYSKRPDVAYFFNVFDKLSQ